METDLKVLINENSLGICELKKEIYGLRKDMNEKFSRVFQSIDNLARVIAEARAE